LAKKSIALLDKYGIMAKNSKGRVPMINTTNEIIHLPLESVRPNPYQPRRYFERSALEELAASIQTYGVLQPISVRATSGTSYELVAGERRLRASRIAGCATIPAIIVAMSDMDSAVLAMIENMQRQDLHFFEEAKGLHNLMSDYGYTQEVLAAKVGKTQSTIANKMRILRLPNAVRRFILENELTERHARALLKLQDEEAQLAVLQKVVQSGFNVRKTEELVESQLKGDTPAPRTQKFVPYIRDIRILANSIKENLNLVRRSGLDTQFDMEQTETGYNIRITVTHAAKKAV